MRSSLSSPPTRRKVYNSVRQRVRHLLGSSVMPRGGTVEQLAIKFPGGSAERSRALLKQYEVSVSSSSPHFLVQASRPAVLTA